MVEIFMTVNFFNKIQIPSKIVLKIVNTIIIVYGNKYFKQNNHCNIYYGNICIIKINIFVLKLKIVKYIKIDRKIQFKYIVYNYNNERTRYCV